MFYLMSRDASQTVRSYGGWIFLIGIFIRNILKSLEVSTTSGSKVMAQTVVFMFLMTLTFDLCSIFWSHALDMMYWNLRAKFHKKHTPKVKSIVVTNSMSYWS